MTRQTMPSWWPHSTASRFNSASPFAWHSQWIGDSGPKILLLHGTGASTHSWAGVMTGLEHAGQICAIDLPGHGFSPVPPVGHSGLDACTRAIAAFLDQNDFAPDIIVGHSAGAAIAMTLAHAAQLTPKVICVNAAFGQFSGIAGVMFPYIAKLAAAAPFSAHILSTIAQDADRVKRLLAGTGSQISADSLRAYCHLFQSRQHVKGTLQFMAEWDLGAFLDRLAATTIPLTLITGAHDKTVPPHISREWAGRITTAKLIEIPTYGHLIQEEAPHIIVDIILSTVHEAS